MWSGITTLLVALVAACASKPATPAERLITLTKGDTLSIKTGTDGKSEITAVILDGKPDAGTYMSTASALVDDARAAKNALPDKLSTVSIRVDASNTITSILHAKELG
ncbi:MAG: hypothetical protein ACYTGN_13860 [Planctomycetota bacterium]